MGYGAFSGSTDSHFWPAVRPEMGKAICEVKLASQSDQANCCDGDRSMKPFVCEVLPFIATKTSTLLSNDGGPDD